MNGVGVGGGGKTEPWGTLLVSVKPMEANLSRRMDCRVKKAAVRPSRKRKSTESAIICSFDPRCFSAV